MFQILTGRVEESRNKMNSGENSKRKNRKDPKVRDSYPANSVPGYMGEESVETLMERIGEESQSNRRDREHGKGNEPVDHRQDSVTREFPLFRCVDDENFVSRTHESQEQHQNQR